MTDKESESYSIEAPLEPEPEPEPEAPEVMYAVRLIGRKGESALVEWLDGNNHYRRAYIPFSEIRQGLVARTVLNSGIPYGVRWEDHIQVTATPHTVANELRRRGMWTWSDIRNDILAGANKAFDTGEFLRLVQQEMNT